MKELLNAVDTIKMLLHAWKICRQLEKNLIWLLTTWNSWWQPETTTESMKQLLTALNRLKELFTNWNTFLAASTLKLLLTVWYSCWHLQIAVASIKELLSFSRTCWELKCCCQLGKSIDSLKQLGEAAESLKKLLAAWNSCWELRTAPCSLKKAVSSLKKLSTAAKTCQQM